MTASRKAILWGAALGLGVPLLAVVILGAEILVARRGPHVPPAPGGVPSTFPDDRLVTALWLGDSTAAGVGVTAVEDVLPLQVAHRLGTDPASVVDLAVSGARVADVVQEQLPRITGRSARVYVSVGANDTTHLTGAGAFRETYEVLIRGIRRLLGDDVEIVALGIPDMGSPTRFPQPLRAVAGWRGRRLDREIRRLAAGHDRITHVPIAAATGPQFRAHPERYFAADRFHPSPAGYALWADAVVDAVRPS